jgi:hypothetical protein
MIAHPNIVSVTEAVCPRRDRDLPEPPRWMLGIAISVLSFIDAEKTDAYTSKYQKLSSLLVEGVVNSE